jgi:MazG family protein
VTTEALHLVYVGAAAELAPAASLRALAGGGPLFVPAGVPADLVQLIAESAGSQPRELQSADAAQLAGAGPATVAVAGPNGPPLARALLAAAAAAGAPLRTTPARSSFDDCLVGQELLSLQRITRILREQCPWDRVQTAQDIVSYSLEEMYELADAIASGDLAEQHGELGDVLFQVYFLSLLLQEQSAGDLGSVAADIERKLIRRHAHIFGSAVADTPAAVRGQWERIKREQEGRSGIFHDVPGTLPALLYARKLQRRAAEVGFDWQTALEAFPKIAEEHAELAEAMARYGRVPEFDDTAADSPNDPASPNDAAADAGGGGDAVPVDAAPDAGDAADDAGGDADNDTSPPSPRMRHDPAVRHEFGDLLFAVTNVARKAGVDPELALREASGRFQSRVCRAAQLADAEGVEWAGVTLDEQERYYRRAKLEEREERP